MTNAELIDQLSKLDPLLPVAVDDADTSWCAPVNGVSVEELVESPGSRYVVLKTVGYLDMKGYMK